MKFNEQKVTEAAAHLLRLRGGQMHYIKLIKLLYLADREALSRWGIPLSHDRYVSMDNGPVLSRTLNLIKDGGSRIWSEHISAPFEDYEVRLIASAVSAQKLSIAEEELLDEIFSAYGHQNRWALVDQMHELPEWRNPHGSSLPISLRDILKALGEAEDEIDATIDELETEWQLGRHLEVA